MEESERFEELSAAETATLRDKRRLSILTLIGYVVLFIAFAYVAISSGSRLYIMLFFPFALPLISILGWRELRSIRSLNRDIQGGKKKIVIAPVESQRQDIQPTGSDTGPSMSYTYLVKVRGKELKVTEAQYYKCKAGQLVEIYLAPDSNLVFSLNVLEDSAL